MNKNPVVPLEDATLLVLLASFAALFSSLGTPNVNCAVLPSGCALPNLNPFNGDAPSDLGCSVLSTPNLNPPGWLAKSDALDGTPNLNCMAVVFEAGSFDFAVPGFEA